MEQDPLQGDLYYSLSQTGTSIFKDRGSKFLGYAAPAAEIQEFQSQLEAIQNKHHDARHHCYAYRLAPLKPQVRINDDGEPAHSAGDPIFHALQSAGLWNAGVVVVRYFGGTKLGVGGLITAYRSAAEEAIAQAIPRKAYLEAFLELRFPYALMSVAMELLQESPAEVVDERMGTDAGYLIQTRHSTVSQVIHKFEERKEFSLKILS